MSILDGKKRPTKFRAGDSISWDSFIGGFAIKRGRQQLLWPNGAASWQMHFCVEQNVEDWAATFVATHGFGLKKVPARHLAASDQRFLLVAK